MSILESITTFITLDGLITLVPYIESKTGFYIFTKKKPIFTDEQKEAIKKLKILVHSSQIFIQDDRNITPPLAFRESGTIKGGYLNSPYRNDLILIDSICLNQFKEIFHSPFFPENLKKKEYEIFYNTELDHHPANGNHYSTLVSLSPSFINYYCHYKDFPTLNDFLIACTRLKDELDRIM
ncbi:MAG TPA: hypothetical protein PLH61_05930 [Bacteroidia bacterium]|nr:hypothetical protein [Bacteroidia bacterium]